MHASPRRRIQNTRVVSRFSEILRLCEQKKVLHLGCADMPFTSERGDKLLHRQLSEVTSPDKLWGLDVSQEGVDLLRNMGFENLILGDVENLGEELRQLNFDIVLAGEIIEHVANPGLFIKGLASIMTERTHLILTTPNATSVKSFLSAFMRFEKVHPDHNFYFSYYTLKHLLEEFGLKCEDIYYYQDVEGRGIPKAIDKALSMMTRFSPALADGVIMRARF